HRRRVHLELHDGALRVLAEDVVGSDRIAARTEQVLEPRYVVVAAAHLEDALGRVRAPPDHGARTDRDRRAAHARERCAVAAARARAHFCLDRESLALGRVVARDDDRARLDPPRLARELGPDADRTPAQGVLVSFRLNDAPAAVLD